MSLWFPKPNTPLVGVQPMSADWYKFFVRFFAQNDPASGSITSDFTVSRGGFYEIDTTSGNIAITLKGTVLNGYPSVTFKRITGGPSTITITADSGSIDGSASLSMPTQYESRTLFPSPQQNGDWSIV